MRQSWVRDFGYFKILFYSVKILSLSLGDPQFSPQKTTYSFDSRLISFIYKIQTKSPDMYFYIFTYGEEFQVEVKDLQLKFYNVF